MIAPSQNVERKCGVSAALLGNHCIDFQFIPLHIIQTLLAVLVTSRVPPRQCGTSLAGELISVRLATVKGGTVGHRNGPRLLPVKEKARWPSAFGSHAVTVASNPYIIGASDER
jgi:hypothetical protein